MPEIPLRIRGDHALRCWRQRLPGPVCCMAALFAAGPAHADEGADGARLMFQMAPVVVHYTPSEDHNNFPRLLGLEYETGKNWVSGASSFLNSFEQPSVYWCLGKRWFVDPIRENL